MPVIVVEHPLITHKITILRDRETSTKKFREAVEEITLLLTYEATRHLPMREVEVDTPLCRTKARKLEDEELIITPILRAGLGMLTGMLAIFPTAKVVHIGVKRDEETAQPHTYYSSLPDDLSDSRVLVVDPMLATAGSLCSAIKLIKNSNPKEITAICLIAAPEGSARVEQEHPEVNVFVGAMDERLNERAFIVPGLGDAGDRMFGTV